MNRTYEGPGYNVTSIEPPDRRLSGELTVSKLGDERSCRESHLTPHGLEWFRPLDLLNMLVTY